MAAQKQTPSLLVGALRPVHYAWVAIGLASTFTSVAVLVDRSEDSPQAVVGIVLLLVGLGLLGPVQASRVTVLTSSGVGPLWSRRTWWRDVQGLQVKLIERDDQLALIETDVPVRVSRLCVVLLRRDFPRTVVLYRLGQRVSRRGHRKVQQAAEAIARRAGCVSPVPPRFEEFVDEQRTRRNQQLRPQPRRARR